MTASKWNSLKNLLLNVSRLIPPLFDFLLVSVERLTVLSIAGFVGYMMFFLVFGGGEPESTRAAKILKVLQENWRPLLILIVPLFYRPVKKFIDELQELGPAKRQPLAEHPLPTPKQQEQERIEGQR